MTVLLALTLGSCNNGTTDTEQTPGETQGDNTENGGNIGLLYEVNTDGTTCTVTGIGSFTGTELEIPEYIDGYKVTSIGEGAFQYCYSLTSIVIPDSVTYIGEWAFSGCGFTSIVIPDSVTSIGDYAFRDCSSLASIVIPDSVTSIGWSVFDGCSALTDVYYTGSEAEWAQISIYGDNEYLTSSNIHYNYVPEN